MPKQDKADSPESMGSSRLKSPPGKARKTPTRKGRYAGKSGEESQSRAAARQARQDAAADVTAARPQQQRGRGRSTTGQGATFSFLVRQRICEAHEEAHGMVRERVVRAKSRGGTASLEGLTAELRALADARRYAGQAHGPAQEARMVEVRRALLNIAASSILLAEAADRPSWELMRGQKSRALQWYTPDFKIPTKARA